MSSGRFPLRCNRADVQCRRWREPCARMCRVTPRTLRRHSTHADTGWHRGHEDDRRSASIAGQRRTPSVASGGAPSFDSAEPRVAWSFLWSYGRRRSSAVRPPAPAPEFAVVGRAASELRRGARTCRSGVVPRADATVSGKNAPEAFSTAMSSQPAGKINEGHASSAGGAFFPRRIAGRRRNETGERRGVSTTLAAIGNGSEIRRTTANGVRH